MVGVFALASFTVSNSAMAVSCGDGCPPPIICMPCMPCDLACPPPIVVISPTANPVVETTDEDTPVSVSLSVNNPSEVSFSYIIVSGPATGTISSLDGGSLTFTPSLNFNTSGADPVTFVFGIMVEGSIVSTSSVTISVRSVNDTPVIVLNGDNPATVVIGTEYVDPGAVCTDVEDGVLSVSTTIGKIIHIGEGEDSETLRVGDRYSIYYRCYDDSESEGGSASASREITVIAVPAPVVVPPTTGGGLLWSPATFTTPATIVPPVGQVLGASTSCSVYVKGFLRRGDNNDKESVKKLQQFLNENIKAGLTVNGVFDLATENALKAFQLKHADEVLKPWGLTAPTGVFYLTTMVAVNNIMCPSLKLPVPTVLVPMSSRGI